MIVAKKKSDPRSSRKRGPHCTAAPDCRTPGWDDPGKFGLLTPPKKITRNGWEFNPPIIEGL